MKQHRLVIVSVIQGLKEEIEILTRESEELEPVSNDPEWERYDIDDGFVELKVENIVMRKRDVIEVEEVE